MWYKSFYFLKLCAGGLKMFRASLLRTIPHIGSMQPFQNHLIWSSVQTAGCTHTQKKKLNWQCRKKLSEPHALIEIKITYPINRLRAKLKEMSCNYQSYVSFNIIQMITIHQSIFMDLSVIMHKMGRIQIILNNSNSKVAALWSSGKIIAQLIF